MTEILQYRRGRALLYSHKDSCESHASLAGLPCAEAPGPESNVSPSEVLNQHNRSTSCTAVPQDYVALRMSWIGGEAGLGTTVRCSPSILGWPVFQKLVSLQVRCFAIAPLLVQQGLQWH